MFSDDTRCNVSFADRKFRVSGRDHDRYADNCFRTLQTWWQKRHCLRCNQNKFSISPVEDFFPITKTSFTSSNQQQLWWYSLLRIENQTFRVHHLHSTLNLESTCFQIDVRLNWKCDEMIDLFKCRCIFKLQNVCKKYSEKNIWCCVFKVRQYILDYW